MIKKLNKNKKARTLVTFLCVLISALSQAYVIQVFIQPANLLSSGFTGVAILIEKITSTYFITTSIFSEFVFKSVSISTFI